MDPAKIDFRIESDGVQTWIALVVFVAYLFLCFIVDYSETGR